jgi:predicted DNA-binding transcriptional regulator AlpA
MRLVSFKELKEVYGVPYSREYIDALIKDEKFPQKIHLNPTKPKCAVVWKEDEILEWQEKQAEARGSKPSGRLEKWLKDEEDKARHKHPLLPTGVVEVPTEIRADLHRLLRDD